MRCRLLSSFISRVKRTHICSCFVLCALLNSHGALRAQGESLSNDDPIAALPAPPVVAVMKTESATAQVIDPVQPPNRSSSPTRPPAIATSPAQAEVEQPLSIPAPDLVPLPKNTESTPAPVAASFRSDSLQQLVKAKNLALPLPDASIVVDKSERRLDLLSRGVVVKSYRVALGNNPVGHKQKQGDSRTPEGKFYICTRNSKTSAFHIFLGLSYPGIPDARRAVTNKQITWREYQIINQRLASRGRPPWETKLGGWVGIHGGTDASYAKKKMRERRSNDWTAGCVGLTNAQIEELYAATRLGTPVEVRP